MTNPASLSFPIVDLDQHYYEPDDCCTRHLDSKFADRSVHMVTEDDGAPHVNVLG